MTINETYEFIMDKLNKLKENGVEMVITEPTKNPETIEKYNKPGKLPHDKWTNITFTLTKESDLENIYTFEHLFKMMGITFDTEYGMNKREWFIDWSLKIS